MKASTSAAAKLVSPYDKTTSIKRKSNYKVKPNCCFSPVCLLYWQGRRWSCLGR
jgi:hypothetical protein